jgi:hypothetical protein
MKTEELFAMLESHALHPVLVEDEGSRLGRPGLIMIGDLERFIKSVQALGEKVVFISARSLREADFVHESEVDDEEIEGNDLVVTPEGFRGPFFKQNSGPKPRQEARWSHHQ